MLIKSFLLLPVLILWGQIYNCLAIPSSSGGGNQNAINKDWWERAIFYQIYPRSFMDSDGDGIGDLRGIISKLDHLKESGIQATWLSPIFQSPMADFGYDISNFTDIHKEYGTMEDFEALLARAKQLGIKIILDFVPNHSSDECEWFKKSIDSEPGYEDFYVWHDGQIDENGIRSPPNNWASVFYGSAWKWNGKRQQYYLHQFVEGQPDLNYRNPKVLEAMDKVLLFWLDKGVDGFRVDAVNHLFEVEDFCDEPISGLTDDPLSYDYTHHYYTTNLRECYDMIYHWRRLLDDYKGKHGGDTRIMLTEAYANISFTAEYYENANGQQGSHIPFNFLLLSELDEKSDARDFLFSIQKWLSYMPVGATANWVMGNHDQPRLGSRYGKNRIDSINMLIQTLPGIAITYNGEEIGMVDYRDITWEETKDPKACNTNPTIYKEYSRDPVRTPFQWDDSKNAGFSTASETWLPVHPNYKEINLELQKSQKRSHYKLYRRLAKLRNHPTMQSGGFVPMAIKRNVLAYKRELSGYDTFVVVINLGPNDESVNLKLLGNLPDNLIVAAAGSESNYREGSLVLSSQINLHLFDCILLSGIHIKSQDISDGIFITNTTLQIVKVTLLVFLLYGLSRAPQFGSFASKVKFL